MVTAVIEILPLNPVDLGSKQLTMNKYDLSISTLRNLLNYDILVLNNAELQLRNILPSWISRASSPKLKEVLHKYLDNVQDHTQRIATFMSSESIMDIGIVSRVMQAHIDEAEDILSYCTDAEVKDVFLLASVQQINHFKICRYGTVASFSKAIGMDRAAEIFHTAEVAEKQIDDRLSQLAEFEINNRAKAPISLPA
jgi:ferritin-like metal-binding protein YciE